MEDNCQTQNERSQIFQFKTNEVQSFSWTERLLKQYRNRKNEFTQSQTETVTAMSVFACPLICAAFYSNNFNDLPIYRFNRCIVAKTNYDQLNGINWFLLQNKSISVSFCSFSLSLSISFRVYMCICVVYACILPLTQLFYVEN